MSAAERIAALDDLPAIDLIAFTEGTLMALVSVMNEETTLLRAGRYREADALTANKTRLAQDYVGFARSMQRQIERLKRDCPNDIARLRQGHESLATQMAENLRVIATARMVTEDLLTDVATMVGQKAQAKTYGAGGQIASTPASTARGIAVNRAL